MSWGTREVSLFLLAQDPDVQIGFTWQEAEPGEQAIEKALKEDMGPGLGDLGLKHIIPLTSSLTIPLLTGRRHRSGTQPPYSGSPRNTSLTSRKP